MAFVTFPEPPELAVRYEDMITDGKPKSFGCSSRSCNEFSFGRFDTHLFFWDIGRANCGR